jgi:hypothetical protein
MVLWMQHATMQMAKRGLCASSRPRLGVFPRCHGVGEAAGSGRGVWHAPRARALLFECLEPRGAGGLLSPRVRVLSGIKRCWRSDWQRRRALACVGGAGAAWRGFRAGCCSREGRSGLPPLRALERKKEDPSSERFTQFQFLRWRVGELDSTRTAGVSTPPCCDRCCSELDKHLHHPHGTRHRHNSEPNVDARGTNRLACVSLWPCLGRECDALCAW